MNYYLNVKQNKASNIKIWGFILKKKQEEETKQRIDDAKKHSQETKKEPNAFETALNKVLGKNPDKLKAEIHSGRLSPELKTVCEAVATRAATNMARTTSKVMGDVAKQGTSKIGGGKDPRP